MNGHGGKRRRHMPPALNAETLPKLSAMKKSGATIREMAAALGVHNSTVCRAINHLGAYQGSGI